MNSFDASSSIQFIAALLLVIALTYALARVFKNKINVVKNSHRIRVMERYVLDHRNVLHIIEIDAKQLLISSNEHGVRLISELQHERLPQFPSPLVPLPGGEGKEEGI